MTYHSITPGRVWLDTDGNRIQAHGGSIITVGDTFYWYGENKEKTTGKDSIWHWACAAIPQRICITGKARGSSSRRIPGMSRPRCILRP